MRKAFLICVFFIVIACSGRDWKAAFEYGDVSNDLHLQVPNHSWIIRYDPECSRQVCWDMTKPDNGARIYLAKVSEADSRDLAGEMNKLRNGILSNHTNNLANVSEVSDFYISFRGAAYVYFSWDVVGATGTIRFHAAYVRLTGDTTKVLLFVGGSSKKYADTTKTDFTDFLRNIGPIMPKTLNQ